MGAEATEIGQPFAASMQEGRFAKQVCSTFRQFGWLRNQLRSGGKSTRVCLATAEAASGTGPRKEIERPRSHADFGALCARANSLARNEQRYLLDQADLKGLDDPLETFSVLKKTEVRHSGEYSARRLVLAAWNWMEESGELMAMGI